MDVNWTYVAFCAGSFIAGSIVGGLCVSRKISREFEDHFEMLENENRELYHQKKKTQKKLEELIERYSEDTDDRIRKNGLRETLNEVSKEYEDDDFDAHFAEREFPEEDDYQEFDSTEPIRITEEDLMNDFSQSELTELTYYTSDGVLLDDRNEPVDDICELLGNEAREQLDNADDETVLFHNFMHDTNYEVHIEYYPSSKATYDGLIRDQVD